MLQYFSDELALALRYKDVGVGVFLNFAHAVHTAHALLDERHYLLIDAVYLASQLI